MVHSGVYKMKEDVLFVSRFVLMSQLETDAKKLDWLKSLSLVKNIQSLSNQADILANLPTQE